MPRKKGTPKTGGRKQGVHNRTTEEVRRALVKLLSDNLANLKKDINSMSGKDRATLLINLAKHCTPPAQDELLRLSDADLDKIIERLKMRKL